MLGYKRKGRASPELLESEDDNHLSPQPHRRMGNDRESSQRKRRSILDGDGYPNEERNHTRAIPGGPRPGYGGFRPHGMESRHPVDYEGRRSPRYFHHTPSSSRGGY